MERPRWNWSLLAPAHWPIWLGFGLLRLTARLPYRLQLAMGESLGGLLRRLMKSRVRVARRNLELCFPEMPEDQREDMIVRVFKSMGIMLMETGIAWYGSPSRIRSLVTLKGFEQLDQAEREGHGVLLLAPHFTTLEICGHMLTLHPAMKKAGLYREHGNPALEWLVRRGRLGYADAVYGRRETRAAIRHLRNGGLLWYAPDQDYERGDSVFVPFFGIQASTTASPHQFARLGTARVLVMRQRRLPDGAGYELELVPWLDRIPSDDVEADCRLINETIEEAIRRCPEQYLWVHRRFKNRPPGEKSLY